MRGTPARVVDEARHAGMRITELAQLREALREIEDGELAGRGRHRAMLDARPRAVHPRPVVLSGERSVVVHELTTQPCRLHATTQRTPEIRCERVTEVHVVWPRGPSRVGIPRDEIRV